MFLPTTFLPPLTESRTKNAGDLQVAHDRFFRERPRPLHYLIQKRYAWMQQYIDGEASVVELGAGVGFSKAVLSHPSLLVTDVSKYPWIDQQVDALNTPFPDGSIDVIICSLLIHHLATPKRFFREVARILKPGGLCLIQEVNTSWFLRLLLWWVAHEGWDYCADVFGEEVQLTSPDDPWTANNAIPELLFSDQAVFENKFPEFKMLRHEYCECLIFPLSGGVIATRPVPNLPWWVLRIVDGIDSVLVGMAPKLFATGQRIVLQKR